MEVPMVDRRDVRGVGLPVNPLRPRVEVIGIGVQKAATSWLFRCLTQHPELRGSNLEGGDKELNFFNRYHEYGYDWYEDRFEVGAWKNVEFSVLYFHDRNVPERIKAYNPDSRLLLCLRNPVERAISQYRHEIRHGRIEYKPGGFWDAVARNPSYVEQGLYAAHLERWLDAFDREQLHVVHHEEIQRDPEAVLASTLKFLGVDPAPTAQGLHRRVNRSLVPAEGPIPALLTWGAKLLRAVVGRRAVHRLRELPALRPVQRVRYEEVGGRDALPPGSVERERLASLFRGDLERLGRLLGRDYGHWN
jgi:hypothetical protein